MANTLGTNLNQVLAAVPSINGNSAIVANYSRIARYSNGNPVSWRKNINSPLSALAVNDLVVATATAVTSDLDAVLGTANVASGGATGPLVNIPVTAGTRTINIPGVVFTDTTKLFRSGSEYTKPNWSYAVANGNTTVTIAPSEPVISNEEASPTAFQYQLN